MHIVFLGARLPLTKTFLVSQGRVSATPYPQVSKVTSFHHEFHGLSDLYALLLAHSTKHHCLFNGQLARPLVNESRAEKTLRAPREWVVFDFDKVEAKDHADVVARYLPPECQQVSYIAQLSASMWRPDVSSWSGHIFMLLTKPIDEQRLKQWFEHLNFNVPALTSQIKLSDSLQALHWPLDRTVAYNSKIIYIAPPRCHGFTPDVNEPIKLVKKKLSTLTIGEFQAIDTVTVRQKINELRRAVGEPDIDYVTTMFHGEEVLQTAGLVDIQGLRTSGDHYIRFNLNGGDSFAYFIDLRNPALIRNFKGEPALKTEDAAPELWKALRKAAPRAVSKPALEEGSEVLAFYATNLGSQVKIGAYLPISRELTLNNASETAARAWMAEYGLVQKGHFPHMNVIFDPTSDVQYVTGATELNTFKASNFMTQPRSSAKASTLAELPPTLDKIVRSILGHPSDAVVSHFINWLAFIFQFRKKAETAWVLNGIEGTGKGTFVNAVLRPIFGTEHVENKQFHELNGEFNGFLERSLFVVFEEANIKAAANADALMAKIKHYITDSPLQIRKMRADAIELANYSNFLFHTNERTPVMVSGTDRRFNFGERQENKLILTPNEWTIVTEGAELEAFADVLQRWDVNTSAVRVPIDTQARADAHEATTAINQLVADALAHGDLQFFIDRMPSDIEAANDFSGTRFNPLSLFKASIDRFLVAAENEQEYIVSEEEAFPIFRLLISDPRYFQDSKTWRTRHYKSLGLDFSKQHRMPGSWDKKVRGVKVKWTKPASMPERAAAPEANVLPIKKGGKK